MDHYQNQEFILNLDFSNTNSSPQEHIEPEVNEDPEYDKVLVNNNDLDCLYETIESGTFIAMRCPSNSLELFFVGEVVFKQVAEDDQEDLNGHFVFKGEKYPEINYLEKYQEGKRHYG